MENFDALDWLNKIFSDQKHTPIKKKDAPIPSHTQAADAQAGETPLDDTTFDLATSWDLPVDFENAYATDPRASGIHAESISDGLILSLCNLGRVDIEYISMITGEDMKSVITTLRGSIFQNPEKWEECFYRGWETREEYLSGNLVRKFKAAQTANKKYNGYFRDNVEALSDAMPPSISTEDIYAPIGAP